MPYVRRRSLRPMGLILFIVGSVLIIFGIYVMGTEM
jgi:hypothetical protein